MNDKEKELRDKKKYELFDLFRDIDGYLHPMAADAIKKAFDSGFDTALEQANARIQELEREVKIFKDAHDSLAGFYKKALEDMDALAEALLCAEEALDLENIQCLQVELALKTHREKYGDKK